MTLERAYFETTVLREHHQVAPNLVPEVYHFDHPMALTVMEYLAPPHIILRKGLIAGTVYPLLAQHMAEYMASTLFNTSLLALSTLKHRKEGTYHTDLVIFSSKKPSICLEVVIIYGLTLSNPVYAFSRSISSLLQYF